jgi:pimeloyl-ACP methyl ester carboxylesterase
VLIGHDWGGVIAWQAALRSVALDGLAILNAPHPAVFRRVMRSPEQQLKSWYVLYFQLPWLPELMLRRNGGNALVALLRRQSPGLTREMLETFRRNIMAPGGATAMLNYYRANAVRLSLPGPWDTPIPVPTLMIWGEQDLALSLSLTEGNEAFVEDFTLRRVAGASHWVQQDAPEAVNQAIANWARAKGLASA